MEKALLFDLDGTLVNSANDIVNSMIEVFEDNNMSLEPSVLLTKAAGEGRASLLQAALDDNDLSISESELDALSKQFSKVYGRRMCETTRLYPGVEDMLAAIDERDITWGIVTNKLTDPGKLLIEQLGLANSAACVVFGDTTEEKKPSPKPLLHAAAQLDLATGQCVFIGDTLNDITAGKSAGTVTVAVMQTNRSLKEVSQWSADAILNQTTDVLEWWDSR